MKKQETDNLVLDGLDFEEGTPDEDAPEWTEAMFREAKPLKEVFPAMYASWQKTRGRPKVDKHKKITTFKLSQEVIDAIKATGKGYNARVDAALRAAFIHP